MSIAPVQERLASIDNRREDVLALHQPTIERVIQAMHTHICTTLSLEDMADIACLSPYYFSRIFHQIVGIPPGEFLATLRLEAAKQLLLRTSMSVTDICFEVGYIGLGSFTTRFTQQVGVAPRHLRRLVAPLDGQQESAPAPQEPNIMNVLMSDKKPSPQLHILSGQVYCMADFRGSIYMGLFPKPIPQGNPISCTILTAPGTYQIPTHRVPAGNYYLLVAAFPPADNPRSYLLTDGPQFVAIHGPVVIQHKMPQLPVDILLRPADITDPPLLSAVPFI